MKIENGDPDVTNGRTASQFKTTCWTLVLSARTDRAKLEELLERYWSPVYAFLRRRGASPPDAEDLTQSFLWEVLIGRDLIGQANAAQGRFRWFVLAALKNYRIDAIRRMTSQKRNPRPDIRPVVEPSESDDPQTAFYRQWAATVFSTALQRTEKALRDSGRCTHWAAFEARSVRPCLYGVEPQPVEGLVQELGLTDRQEIYDLSRSAARRCLAELREVVAETVDNPDDVESELAELRKYLAM